jgi:stress response protein YsnF
LSVPQEVEHDTVEAEDKIRRVELDLDTQCFEVIDNTKTL